MMASPGSAADPETERRGHGANSLPGSLHLEGTRTRGAAFKAAWNGYAGGSGADADRDSESIRSVENPGSASG